MDYEEITLGKYGKQELGVSTTVVSKSFPPNVNIISGYESYNATAAVRAGGGEGCRGCRC